MRSRLFCRQSDPHALLAGVHSVEACSKRLFSVVHTLGGLIEGIGGDGTPSSHPLGAGPLQRAMTEVLEATNEISECASAIEAAAYEQMPEPASTDVRWSKVAQEHYPELLAVDIPSFPMDSGQSDTESSARAVARCRLQISAVKDRYSTVLPGLPWIGVDREEFTGKRLTKVRVQLEFAVESLDEMSRVEQAIDLTGSCVNLAIA
jgi:hypothetical protein